MQRRTLAVVAVVSLVVLGGVAATVTWAAAGNPAMRSVSYSADTSAISNPERGWYDRITTIVDQRDFSSEKADGITLLHSYVQLDAFVDSPIDDATLTGLQEGLDAVRSSGLKIVLRFAYNQGPSSANGGADAPEAITDEHLKQLTPILAKNADVIASVEAGFVGQWGEWHDSTNGLDKDAAAKKRILAAILKAVPTSRDVELRYPADYRAIEGTAGTSTVASGSTKSRVGNHQDCFVSSTPDDTGTWDRDGNSPATDKKLIAGIGRYAFVGGETCAVDPATPSRSSCPVALKELAQMHFSYLNRDFDTDVLNKFKDGGCYDTIGNKLGYRVSMTSASLPKKLKANQVIPLTVSLKNTGFASPVNKRPVYLVLSNGTTTETMLLKTVDPRTWDPGTKITIKTTKLAQTKKLAAGTYTMSLWLPDASTTLRSNPAYSIHLASTGVWDAATGYNKLGTVTVTK